MMFIIIFVISVWVLGGSIYFLMPQQQVHQQQLQQQVPPPPPSPLRRQTHSCCENDNCRAVRESYGVGYRCWNCGHVQQTNN